MDTESLDAAFLRLLRCVCMHRNLDLLHLSYCPQPRAPNQNWHVSVLTKRGDTLVVNAVSVVEALRSVVDNSLLS